MKKTFILLVLPFVITGLQAQNVKTTTDKSKIFIGERLTLTFKVPVRGEILSPPLWNNDSLEMLAISHSITTENGKDTAVFKAVFTSFSEGERYIPSLTVIDLDSVTKKETKYHTDSVLLNVAFYPVDTAKIEPKDIKPIMKEPFSISEILPLIWLLLILAAAGFGLYFLIRHLKGRKRHIPLIMPKPEPLEPADVRALRALDDLKQKGLPQQGQKKRYYSEMTDILRNFLMEGFGIYAMEMTSSEIIFALQQQVNTVTDEENLARLRYILTTADLVKFAKHEPDTMVDDKCIAMSREFVVKSPIKGKEVENNVQ
ncbi:MAG: hypothetical protein LBR17_05310 [Bacteroidales bacterium]|jgi:hypothetical protein|nr:hypothetical protein [Bacteroidales bacterium]